MREIVVTGGGTGIGRAIAEAFVQAGDHVVITGRRRHVLEKAATDLKCGFAAFDVTDPDDVTRALDELPARIDVLVNNAGGNTDFDRAEPSDLHALAENWRSNFDANVLSTVLVTEALTPRLTEHARIISIGSIAAKKGAGSYGAAKAALEAWTADIAGELGSLGITANVVSPGLILDTEFFRDRLTEERTAKLIDNTFSGRAGRPEDVASAVFWLASREARHVTGQVIHVNGGAYLGR
jgi:3-oxoacyl-[acyl-carrier protein] reductase